MKIFKKAISLVLVFAMLASFAGMTGYSPASIIAQAATSPNSGRVTYELEGGYSVTVASTWYKARYDYSGAQMTYYDNNVPADYYGIAAAHPWNDLRITFTAPSNGAWAFYQSLTDKRKADGSDPDLSADDGNTWGAGGAMDGAPCTNPVAFTGLTEVTRDEISFMDDDLGKLYNSSLNTNAKQGFRDVDKIYLVFAYKVSGVTKYAYIDVNVEFAPVSISYSSSAENYGKPNGSFAATNQASLDVPPILYENGNGKIISSATSKWGSTGATKTATFDTTLTVTLPDGIRSSLTDFNGDGTQDAFVRLNIIDENENILYVYSLKDNLDPYPNGLKDEDGNVIYPAVDSQTGVYKTNEADSTKRDLTFDLLNQTNIIKNGNHKMLYYRIDYIIPQTKFASASSDADGITMSELGMEQQNVMYSQFAASAVRTVPNFRAGYMIPTFGGWFDGNNDAEWRFIFNFQQGADFSAALGVKGVFAEATYRSKNNSNGVWNWLGDTWSASDSTRTYAVEARHAGGYGSGKSMRVIYGGQVNENTKEITNNGGISYGGLVQDHMGGSSDNVDGVTNTMGATVYYDIYYFGEGDEYTFDISTDFIENSSISNSDSKIRFNKTEVYYEMFVESTDGPQYEYFGGHGVSKQGWQSTGYTANGGVNYKDLDDNKTLTNFYRSSSAFAVAENVVTSDQTMTYKIKLTGGNQSYNFLNAFVSRYHDYNFWNKDEASHVAIGLAYHIDIVPVNRKTSHDYITDVIDNNYIKAEMSTDWWDNYRTSVLNAYYNCGYLYSTDAPFTVNTSYINNPVYGGADYDRLEAALIDNPAYEKGNVENAADGIKIPHGTQWSNMQNTSVTGAYYYTADTWEAFVEARQRAYALAYASYKSVGTYNYGKIENLSIRWDSEKQKYYIHPDSIGMYLLYCYAQEAIDEATAELIRAKNALKLKSADYSAMGDAINDATDAGDTEYIANHNNATYNTDSLNFKVQNGDYTGTYYDYKGDPIDITVGAVVSQKNFTTTSATALRTSLQKRLFVYDWVGDTNNNGMPDNLENGSVAFNYAHSGTFSPIAPATGSFVTDVFTTSYATAANETKLNGGASKYYLSIGYQNAINAAINDIKTKTAALRLRVNPKALGTAIENARYIKIDGTKTYLYSLQGNNDTYDTTDRYTADSWDAYLSAMKVSVTALYGDGSPHTLEKSKTTLNYVDDFTAKDTDLASGDPGYYTSERTMKIIDSNGDEITVTPANRQQEYNYALENAKNAQLLLVEFADYTAALERVNNKDNTKTFTYTDETTGETVTLTYLPEFDQGGKSAITGFTGAQWYTEETWKEFVAKRNALANLLCLNGTENKDGYNYTDGIAGNFTRGIAGHDQKTIDDAVRAYDKARADLKLRTMSEYTDSSNKTYDTLNAQVETMLAELEGSKPVYTIVDGELDKESVKVTKFRNYAELVGIADRVKAIKATDSLVNQYAEYEAALTSFNNKYNEVKAQSNNVVEDGWFDIFEHLSMLADGTTTSVTVDNVLANLNLFYVDENNTVRNAIEAIMTAYSNVKKGTHLAEGEAVYAYNSQDEINAQVEALYTLLSTKKLPAQPIATAISAASDEGAETFNAYNPYNVTGYESHALHKGTNTGYHGANVYTTESVATLQTAIDALTAENTEGYILFATPVSEHNDKANTIKAKAGLYDDGNGGKNYKDLAGNVIKPVLVENGADIAVLQAALNGASIALSANQVEANYIYAEKNPGSEYIAEDVEYPHYYDRYTAESVAELQYVVNEANALLAEGNLSASDQLRIDKVVFSIFEEMDDTREKLINDSTTMTDPYRTWVHTYENGVITASTPTDNAAYDDAFWQSQFYNQLNYKGLDLGLKTSPACYHLLELEIKHAKVGDETAGAWDENGEIVKKTLADGTTLDVGQSLYSNWSDYTKALEKAQELVKAWKDGNGLTAEKQDSEIDAAALALYNAREKLQYNDFTGHPNYMEAVNFYNNNINRFNDTVNVFEYSVNEDKSGTTKSDPVPVKIYKDTAVAQAEAILAEFYAKWVGSPTEKNTDEAYQAMCEAQTSLLTELNNLATNTEYVKLMNDESFLIGWKDLNESFIPANYADLLSNTDDNNQVAALAEKIGLAEALITNDAATKTNLNELIYRVNEVYVYTTTTPATNLQFATYMRDNELFAFLDYEMTGYVPFYYQDEGVSPEDNSGMYTQKLFDEKFVNDTKASVNALFGEENADKWPLIYQVNGLGWSIDENNYVAGVDGYVYDAEMGEYTGENSKISDILNIVASHSGYYIRAVSTYINPYNTAPYFWLLDNAFKKEGNVKYVLGDISVVNSDGELPKNYNMTKDDYNGLWYTDGCGFDGYYIYEDPTNEEFPSWFIHNDGTMDQVEMWRGNLPEGIAIRDFYAFDKASVDELKDVTPVDFYNYTMVTNQGLLDYVTELSRDGWTFNNFTQFSGMALGGQGMIDGWANSLYSAIQCLKVRPATEAYREVYLTYLGLQGKTTVFTYGAFEYYEGIEISDGVDVYTFYNLDKKTFLDKIEGETVYDEAQPPYGTIPKTLNLWEKYKKSTDDYTGSVNQMQELDKFIDSLPDERASVTIDQAHLVYSYDGLATIDSKYEELISIASQLELKEVDASWINAILETFLTGKLHKLNQTEEDGGYWNLFQRFPAGALTFESTASSSGDFYNNDANRKSYYTDESLVAFARVLDEELNGAGLITDGVILTDTSGNKTVLVTDNWEDFRNNTAIQALDSETAIALVIRLVESLNSILVLRAAETTELDRAINATAAAYNNPALYVQDFVDENGVNTWTAFTEAYKAALAAKAKCDENADGYFTAAEHQADVDAYATALFEARSKIKERSDASAPQISVSINAKTVVDFYSSDKKDEGDNTETNAQQIARVDSVVGSTPATGTLFMPNNGGYSLIVYTNEVNPRILLQIEDIAEKIENSTIAASKHETLRVSSQRTSGTTTNLIYGTMAGNGVIADITNRNLKKVSDDGKSGPLEEYVNSTKSISDPTKNEEGSSVFAILAPTFDTSKVTGAAVYKISVNDVVPQNSSNFVNGNNYSNSIVIGDETVKDNTVDDTITVYIYYHSSMADGNDEGIVVNSGKVALATPAHGATHVPSVLFSDELTYNGAWRNRITLSRTFDSTLRSWEFMSIIKDNSIGDVNNVAYTDPNFGEKNLGSFYYVLDKTTDAEIYAVYNNEKNSTGGLMDYDRATAAKLAMIDKINEMSDTQIESFTNPKENKGFNYYGAVDADGNYVNWAQVLYGKVSIGDLVFVHVVDRWGNVVNRIIEITNYDVDIPSVTATANTSGYVTISEAGGSGLKDITVHNGDFTLGNFDYEVSTSQKVNLGETAGSQVSNKATVESADDKLTITGLVPGKLYYIGAYDNAGNAASTPVNADSEGKITLTISIETEKVETGEEGSIVNNSSTFTLNGTDVITINAGEASSVLDAAIEGNVFANRIIRHYVTTKDTVTALKTVYEDGTEKEWTSSNALIKNNGDGTAEWTISHKFAEGEHSVKVYAKVSGEYESYYAPVEVTATLKTVTLTYTVIGMGSIVLNYSGAREIKDSSYNAVTLPYGAKVSIASETNAEGCEFYYWINNNTNRIISTASEYSFTAVTNVNFNAQFTSCSTFYEGEKLVIYVNNAKNVIKAFELADGEGYTVPTGPVLPDYTFKGWSMTKAEVLESDKDTIIVEPIYELNATNTVTITEGNYTATGAGTYTAEDNQRAVVTISADAKDGDGKDFLYWIDADTEEIVSYYRTYSFFCVKDTVLTPVYGDGSTVQAEPIVRITEVKYNALSGKVSFFAERSIPEEFAILQTGIVVTKTESIGTNEEVFVVGGTSTATGTSTSTANNGFYSANATVATGQTVWARAYVIYETANGEILEAYGPVVSYTVD